MRRMINCCAMAVMLTGIMVSMASAGDKEDVLTTHDALLAAWNSGDVEQIKPYYLPELTRFGGNGLLAQMWDWDRLKERFQAGMKFSIQPRHRQVAVYGNTAIITGYLIVNTTQPDGKIQNATHQYTAVFVKQDGKWKEAHLHQSPLVPQQPE